MPQEEVDGSGVDEGKEDPVCLLCSFNGGNAEVLLGASDCFDKEGSLSSFVCRTLVRFESNVTTPQAVCFFVSPFAFEQLESDISAENAGSIFSCDVDTDGIVAATVGEGIESGFDQANGFFAFTSELEVTGSVDEGRDCLKVEGSFAAAC